MFPFTEIENIERMDCRTSMMDLVFDGIKVVVELEVRLPWWLRW